MQSRILMLAGASFAGLVLGSCGQKPAPAESVSAADGQIPAEAQAMRIVQVDQRQIAGDFEATGRLVTREEASVGAEISGFPVATVLVDEGDWVKAGQPMARLDDTLLRAQIVQAEAALVQQQANATFKQSQLTRWESLAEAQAVSVESIEARRAESATAQAAVLAADAAVKEMKTRQARMVLRAPVTGRVLQRSINPGQISSAGATPYFRIAREGLVELDAEMPNERLAQISQGSEARVELPNGETVIGKVRFISPRVEESTGLGRARVELPFNDALRPGGFARAIFAGDSRQVMTVRASAVRYESGETLLMAVDEQKRVNQTSVVLGQRFGDYIEIVSGVRKGAWVLEKGAAFTLDGDVINPLKMEDAPAAQPASEPAAADAPTNGEAALNVRGG